MPELSLHIRNLRKRMFTHFCDLEQLEFYEITADYNQESATVDFSFPYFIY